MTTYTYFVAYAYLAKTGGLGLGRATIDSSSILKNERDFRDIEESIKEDTGQDAIIISFQLLKETAK